MAGGTDDPVDRSRRGLHRNGVGGAIPDDAPTHGPAVAGAHDAAVDEVDGATVDVDIVDEQTGAPALVRFDGMVAVKLGVEDDVGALLSRLAGDEEDLVAGGGRTHDECLRAGDGEGEVLRGALDGNVLHDVDVVDSDAARGGFDADVVGGFFEMQVS